MLIQIFAVLASIPPFLTPCFLIAFWVVARKRFPVGAIPWVIAYGVLSKLMPMLQKAILQGANLGDAISALSNNGPLPTGLAAFISSFSIWLIFVSLVQTPLIVLLVLSNVAAALTDGPQESRVWRFFTGAYRWRRTLGVTLLASVVGGSFSFWSAVWYLQSLAR